MARFCGICQRSFPTQRGFQQHNSVYHRHPKPRTQHSTYRYHPHLTARPCDPDGFFLADPEAPPPAPLPVHDFQPFPDRPTFEAAELLFEKMAASKDDVKQLLRVLHSKNLLDGHNDDSTPLFGSHQQLLDAIDAIDAGGAEWHTFSVRYGGPQRQHFVVHTCNALDVITGMAASPDFVQSWETRPYQEFNEKGERIFSNLMSAHWAWKQADEIAKNPETHGSMFTPICVGLDKTTTTVATGSQEFHPVYLMAGNVTNEMRRAHRDAIVPLAFLPIPKGGHEDEDDPEFRLFKKQIYHEALRRIFEPLRPGMSKPHVLQCPDGHYRRAIFGIGPIIADYPEQVYLSGIVQGWCAKCQAPKNELDSADDPRFREHTHALLDTFDPGTLWDVFGIVDDVKPFTSYFPRADIHELLAPDLLHQLVKGTFKDHLVTWVEQYIYLTAPNRREAKRILDDIDRRIAAAPAFPDLRRFPQGRNFKQWTGNDSKALMKVYLPALTGYVPDKMIKCLAAFLDFAFLARRSSHTLQTLREMDAALARFRRLREVFVETGVRPDGFGNLPRQHALFHYTWLIKLYGSPNGVCTSLTESKHIVAVKRPWRSSNRNNPLIQILRTNTRLSKLAALRVVLGRRGMLHGDVLSYTFHKEQIPLLGKKLGIPKLHALIRRFLRDQLFPGFDEPDEVVPLNACPWILPSTRVACHASATATFFAPSELCDRNGMHSEIIRCTPKWRKQQSRYDTVLVQLSEDPGLQGMGVGRVRAFLAFAYGITLYECAVLEWFEFVGDHPDPVTGMWIVRQEMDGHQQAMSIVSIDSIVRACHLTGVYGTTHLPSDFHFTETLDAFQFYYVNHYVDYHSFEILK
ncbi:hypothetical protein C8Q79DRAFT_1002821 [Trametes meyenii]|nr:hypothetical protein C8Q79DRAFT_1002821 [Trametes meyenii]